MKKSTKLYMFFFAFFFVGALILILLRIYHKIPDKGFIGGFVGLSFYLFIIVWRASSAKRRERGLNSQ